MKRVLLLGVGAGAALALVVSAQAPAPRTDDAPVVRGVIQDSYGEAGRGKAPVANPQASPYAATAARRQPTRVLWGDMHVHSANSPDAFASGSLINQVLDERGNFGRVIIAYGARDPGELLFKDELERWAERSDVELHLTVDWGDETWSGPVGSSPPSSPRSRSTLATRWPSPSDRR